MGQQYLTVEEFLDQSIPTDAVSTLSNDTINKALLWASGVASSYLRKRYALPLVSWGEELRSAVGDLARWKLFGRIGVRPGSGNNEIARLAFEDTIEWLKQVSEGLVQIECVDATPMVDEEGSLAASAPPMSWRMYTGSGSGGTGSCDE